jgi:ABC-2 type transport system permease protein
MIADILTVMWKERKGLFRQRGSRTRAVLTMLVPVVMVAIYFPWSMGSDWVDTPWSLLACFIVPMILVGISIPDSIAGEKERHTLATLLASRLSDRSILFGKMATSIAYAWGTTLVVLLLALVTVNIAHWDGQILFYSLRVILSDLAFSFLVAGFVASLGVMLSLRAATAQEAQQTLMAAVMFPPLILGFVPLMLRALRPGWFDGIVDALSGAGFTQVILVILAVILVTDIGLLRLVMARFRRARLITE